MVFGSEMKALKTVAKENGETTTRLVSRQLGIDASYATVLCGNLIKSEHLALETRGRFSITPKGKMALGWSDAPKDIGWGDIGQGENEQKVPLGKIQREEFQWRSLRSFRGISRQAGNGFFKPGQEEVAWTTMDFGHSGRPGRFSRSEQTSLNNEKTLNCGFCRGTGKKAKGAGCPVCRGKGRVSIVPPTVPCAYCKSTGTERRTGRICPVCRGKGAVSVHPPIGVCGQCQGTGAEQGTGLTCLKCSGKGVVHVPEMAGNGRNERNRGIN